MLLWSCSVKLSLKLFYYSLIEVHWCLGTKWGLLPPRLPGLTSDTSDPVGNPHSAASSQVLISSPKLCLALSLFFPTQDICYCITLVHTKKNHLIYQPLVALDKSSPILCLPGMILLILLFLLVMLNQPLGQIRIPIKVKKVKIHIMKTNIRLRIKILDRMMRNRTIQACLGTFWL